MNTNDFFEKINELLDIPDRLSLIQTCLQPVAGLNDKERDTIIKALDASIILSFCKVTAKNIKVFEKAIPCLKKEDPVLYEKILYFKAIRDKAIAHMDLDNLVDRICLHQKSAMLGNTLDEVLKSYYDVLKWILVTLNIRGFFRAINKLNEIEERKIPDEAIEEAPVLELLKLCRETNNLAKKHLSEIVENEIKQVLKGDAT
jgi:hypothetical protein